MVRDPEAEGGVQALTALQEDLLEVAEARTEVRVVGADPRQAGLPAAAVAAAVAIGRSRSREPRQEIRGIWDDDDSFPSFFQKGATALTVSVAKAKTS